MKKILVVDNNPVILKLMENFLLKEGHEVVVAKNGLEALEAVKSFEPDIFFVDLVMPKITGDKLCRILRTQKKFTHAFIVILSAVAVEQQVDFTAFGADACIAKGPFKEVEQHIRCVIDAIDSNKTSHLANTILGTEKVFKRIVTEELLSTKKHFETTLNHMAEGFIELTSEFKVVYVNPSAAAILGRPEEKILSENFTDFFMAADKNLLIDTLQKVNDKSPVTVGEKKPFQINNIFLLATFIMVESESTKTIITILQDITERKIIETELEQYRNNLESIVEARTTELTKKHAQLLREINERQQIEKEKLSLEESLRHTQKMEALGTMAAGISHDFNNILTAVLGFTELTLREVRDNEQLSANLSQVIKAGRRAKDLIRSILTFSRQKDHEFSPIRIQTILKEVIKLLRASTPANITVVEKIEDCEAVMADATQVHQIILNLYTNAIQAMKEGGTLTISLRSSRHNSLNGPRKQNITNNFVDMIIEDTGLGMSKETLAKIYDPYFTTKEAGEGTGMGLAVVHGIITSHGGTISAESRPREGSLFVVQFPVASIDVKEELGEDIEMFTGTEHILIVDDEPAILMIMAQTLGKLGYKTTSAKNGTEALEIYLKNKDSIDIVLTDITMPVMTGLSLAEKLLKTTPELPIILCTGKQLSPSISDEQLHELGVKSLLTKPFSLASLSTSIRTALADN